MNSVTVRADGSSGAAVLFDFDGTVGRSLHHWAEAMRTALAHHDVKISHDEVVEYCFFKPFSDIVTRFNLPCSQTFRDKIWSEVKALMSGVDLFDGVVDTIALLRNDGFQIGIVTNSRRAVVSPVLERHGILGLFDTIIGEEDVEEPKPSPEPVLKALSNLKAPPRDSWMIGDSDADVKSGLNAGVNTIGFAPHDNLRYSPRHRLTEAGADHIIETYQELRAIITGRLRDLSI